MIHVCVPVLRRYDLFRGLLESLEGSTVPYVVHAIDNGRSEEKMRVATAGFFVDIYTPSQQMGVAESWNWFIDNVPEERIIANDDIIFAPESLEKMSAMPGDIVWAREAGFSCFLIRDSCVRKIGVFDESISPGYGYFEDCDYSQRIDRRGAGPVFAIRGDVETGIEHLHSKTLEAATPAEIEEHHRRFLRAKVNYQKKWNTKVS